MEDLYDIYFKRKSFHLFKDLTEKLSEKDYSYIDQCINNLKPLFPNIKYKIKVVKANKTTCKRGEECCILFYSEEKSGYLQNIGYIGEQLDLLLTKTNIATLWCGLARPTTINYPLMKFVIMIAISKCSDQSKYRKDMYKAKRKDLSEIYEGKNYEKYLNIARFSPSACNSQPWKIKENKNELTIYRYTKEGKSGLMPELFAHYYNKIDIGIFIYIMEIILAHHSVSYDLELFKESKPIDRCYKNAVFKIK